MSDQSKYARIERERRFLLAGPPAGLDALTCRDIEDRYLANSGLRLRWVGGQDGVQYKLTQKRAIDSTRGWITTIYLDRNEFNLLAALPGRVLRKRRYRYPHAGTLFAIDVFEAPLDGLVLAEAEAATDAQLGVLPELPLRNIEVTERPEFRGDYLAGPSGQMVPGLARRLWGSA
jgi:CYTH domain-containing protein